MDVSLQLLQQHAAKDNYFLLVIKNGFTVLIPKQNDRAWNGTMLHLQRRRPEP
jgi:hypothetical protein